MKFRFVAWHSHMASTCSTDAFWVQLHISRTLTPTTHQSHSDSDYTSVAHGIELNDSTNNCDCKSHRVPAPIKAPQNIVKSIWEGIFSCIKMVNKASIMILGMVFIMFVSVQIKQCTYWLSFIGLKLIK